MFSRAYLDGLSNQQLATLIGELQQKEKTERAIAICMSDTSDFYSHEQDQQQKMAKADDTQKTLNQVLAYATERIAAKKQKANLPQPSPASVTEPVSSMDIKFK